MNTYPNNHDHINLSFNDNGAAQNDFSYLDQPNYYDHCYDQSNTQFNHFANDQANAYTNQQATESNQKISKEDIFTNSQAPYVTREDGGNRNRTNKKANSKNTKADASNFEASNSQGLYLYCILHLM